MQTAQITGNTALTNVAAIIGEIADVNPGQRVEFDAPQVTGVAAGASVTITIAIGGTTIGTAVATNSGAGAAAVGPIRCVGVCPAGAQGVATVSGVMSSGTGTLVGAATTPDIITTLP